MNTQKENIKNIKINKKQNANVKLHKRKYIIKTKQNKTKKQETNK